MRSSREEIFCATSGHGRPAPEHCKSFSASLKDHGQLARLWVFSFVSYLQACKESRHVPFVTCSSLVAILWQRLFAAATMEQFKQGFLQKNLKPSESIETRGTLQFTQAKQCGEAYATQLFRTHARVSLGTSIDSSTRRRWFRNGLNSNVRTVLAATASVQW